MGVISGLDLRLVGSHAGVEIGADGPSLHAAEILHEQGISASVIDGYSIKPIDTVTLTAAANVASGRIVIAEDHHPEGGLGCAVIDALLAARQSNLTITHLAVRGMPDSGTSTELLAWAGIDADHIATVACQLIGRPEHDI